LYADGNWQIKDRAGTASPVCLPKVSGSTFQLALKSGMSLLAAAKALPNRLKSPQSQLLNRVPYRNHSIPKQDIVCFAL